jgi:ribosomal protein S11
MKETGLKQIKVSFNGTVVHQLQATGQKINVDVSGWQKGV